ncbi:MAG: DNA-packaging protein [Alphaproteobacteria bacterium]|nr:DNA-packaging protein [Alphaproteobacteria bacterium]
MRPELRLGAGLLACAGSLELDEFLGGLSENAILALPYLFDLWAMPHQLPPEGDWKTWVILGGRGAGKTRAGAEWVRGQVEGARPLDGGRARRVALVGETIEQVREVMIFGDSGIMNCVPPDRRPKWEATRKRLVWPNGAVAQVFSAHDPESLRGPQFDAAWVDELAKWKKGRDAWDMLQFGLRLGESPCQVVTTTPQNTAVLKEILAADSTVKTSAATSANRAYLARSFLEEVTAKYGGTRLGRQELEGELLSETDGALWTGAMIDAAHVDKVPKLDRIVVAVDPPVTGHKNSDECGIIVAGAVTSGSPTDWQAFVLADVTVSGASPQVWAKAALEAYREFGADRLVAEVNQGGDLVETVIRQNDPLVSYRAVRATRGKAARAEPVAALYEQGRVKHVGGLHRLEDQMGEMTSRGFEGRGSPDRVDALVWALTDLMIEAAGRFRAPRVRGL